MTVFGQFLCQKSTKVIWSRECIKSALSFVWFERLCLSFSPTFWTLECFLECFAWKMMKISWSNKCLNMTINPFLFHGSYRAPKILQLLSLNQPLKWFLRISNPIIHTPKKIQHVSRSVKTIRGQSWRSKRNCWLGQVQDRGLHAQGCTQRLFFNLQLWPIMFLQPLDQNKCLVPHLKDLLHISLEPEAEGHGMTFKVYNLGT